MKNEISFRTGDKPITVRGSFPYERLIKSLEALIGTEKAVILDKGEITINQITFARTLAKRMKLGYLKSYTDPKTGEIRMWINRPAGGME